MGRNCCKIEVLERSSSRLVIPPHCEFQSADLKKKTQTYLDKDHEDFKVYTNWEDIQVMFGTGGLLETNTPPTPESRAFRLTQSTIFSPYQSKIDKHLKFNSI